MKIREKNLAFALMKAEGVLSYKSGRWEEITEI